MLLHFPADYCIMIIVINSNKQEGVSMKVFRRIVNNKVFRPGNSYLVKSLDYNNKASKQLIDMGITPNTTIYIESAAPLGEPLVVKVRDYKVALRSKDLGAIEVEHQKPISINNALLSAV